MMAARHDGQLAWAPSQASMQATWKAWLQCGSTRSSSASTNSARQMAHSPPLSPWTAKETVGSASMDFFFNPLANELDKLLLLLRAGGQRQAHRVTSARPMTLMRAQRREATMTTMSESTEMAPADESPGGGGGGGRPSPAPRRGRMLCSLATSFTSRS
jgi:hypothetical protein